MINLTNGWNGPYFQTIRWQTYIESFSPLNFTDFHGRIKWLTHGAYQLVVSEKPGKTWKNPGDLTTTQKNPEESSGGPWCRSTPGHSLWPWLKIGGTGMFIRHTWCQPIITPHCGITIEIWGAEMTSYELYSLFKFMSHFSKGTHSEPSSSQMWFLYNHF